MPRVLDRVLAVALLAATGVLAVGCTSSGAARSGALPAGVTVDVYQTRTDPAARRLQISVANASAHDLTITAAELDSPQFAAPAIWTARPGGALVRAGTAIDLPASLAAPACEDPAPVATVRITYQAADGRGGSAEVPAVDRFDRLPAMRAEECFAAAIADVAVLRIDAPVRISGRDGTLRADLSIAFSPTGAAGSIRIEAVEDTVLLALAAPDGTATDRRPIGLEISGADAPGSFEIPILPARCDPHAVAEDKQGTIFIVRARAADGTAGSVRIAASDATRSSIYAYIAEACGFPQ